jgi:glycosyltransferase involved in cell wall biosynthesis
MKLLFFTENLHCGGLDSFLINLVDHWPDAKDDVVIMCNRHHPGREVLRSGISRSCKVVSHDIPTYAELVIATQQNTVAQGLRRFLSPLLKFVYLVRCIIALRGIFDSECADRLVVVNGGHPGGDTCRAAVIAWRIFASRKPRAVYNFHGVASSPRLLESGPERLLDLLIVRYAGVIIGVSRACADSLRVRIGEAGMKKVGWIYNGIAMPDTDAPSATGLREELDIPSSDFLCLMLATYESGKGHDFLLQAFCKVRAEVPAAFLVICGYGYPHEIANVQRLVQLYDLANHVNLQGFRSDVTALLQQADVLLVASQAPESFGLTCVEAMANRTPVVATRVGGIPEVVVDGDGGFCVDRDDIQAYADKVVALLKNANFREEQGRKGLQRYMRLFSAVRMAEEYALVVHANDVGEVTQRCGRAV